jgi:hypothetical protein
MACWVRQSIGVRSITRQAGPGGVTLVPSYPCWQSEGEEEVAVRRSQSGEIISTYTIYCHRVYSNRVMSELFQTEDAGFMRSS